MSLNHATATNSSKHYSYCESYVALYRFVMNNSCVLFEQMAEICKKNLTFEEGVCRC